MYSWQQLLLCWDCSLSWIWLPRGGLSSLWWATFSETPVALIQFVVAASPFYCEVYTGSIAEGKDSSECSQVWLEVTLLTCQVIFKLGKVKSVLNEQHPSMFLLLFWFMGETLLCLQVKSCALPCSSKALLMTGWTHRGALIPPGYFWV